MTLQSMMYRVEASIIRNNSMRHESECPKTATHRDTPSVDPRHIPEKIPDAKQRHADRTVLARFFWNCSLQCLNFFFFICHRPVVLDPTLYPASLPWTEKDTLLPRRMLPLEDKSGVAHLDHGKCLLCSEEANDRAGGRRARRVDVNQGDSDHGYVLCI